MEFPGPSVPTLFSGFPAVIVSQFYSSVARTQGLTFHLLHVQSLGASSFCFTFFCFIGLTLKVNVSHFAFLVSTVDVSQVSSFGARSKILMVNISLFHLPDAQF